MSSVLLKRCTACKEYTLQDACPRCGKAAKPNRPAKYSPEDNYGVYRRKLKKLDASEKAEASGHPPMTPIPPGGASGASKSAGSARPADGPSKPKRV
jgi:H/ACA ribonucleoprotein complex subunit 3